LKHYSIPHIVFLLVLFAAFSARGQRQIPPSDSLKIEGAIKAKKIYTLAQLDTFTKVYIHDQVTCNNKGEPKDTLKNMRGILLKTLLAPIEYVYEKPRYLNEFYLVLVGSDGYRVVVSWNELYNTDVGNQFYIITEMDGKKVNDISCISTSDLNAGRRHVRGLERIEVRQVK
jgi:hypothetical protein